ncbi:MAG: fasciclin domain-containing protein [Parvularcula sp.]|jgi:uncharacterized surface protein with fasciclin (FAS1) repeats|nr:fasciclin domain-containing protein [Parvularcula sp.]
MKNFTALAAASLGLVAMGPLAAVPAFAQQTADQQDKMSSKDNYSSKDKMSKSDKKGEKTIVGVADGNKDFSTLVKAVKTAELTETLEGDGPYTVFAPNNAAFDDLPEGAVDQLLMSENREALRSVLTYHVIKGAVRASDLVSKIEENNGSYEVATVEGETLTAELQDGNVVLKDIAGNTIKVVDTDIAASNGVIHVVDTVLLPVRG